MSDPVDVISARFGNVFVYPSKTLNVVSSSNEGQEESIGKYMTYSTLLDVGTLNPVVLVALVKGTGASNSNEPVKFSDLEWDSVHVRSYANYDDMLKSGIEIKENNPQAPAVGVLHNFKDISMQAVTQTETSKSYRFEATAGNMTVFCQKPVIAAAGNELPRKTTLLPWIQSHNFVYQK